MRLFWRAYFWEHTFCASRRASECTLFIVFNKFSFVIIFHIYASIMLSVYAFIVFYAHAFIMFYIFAFILLYVYVCERCVDQQVGEWS